MFDRGHFDKIYDSGTWNGGMKLRQPSDFYSDANWPTKAIRQKSSSGMGSNLGAATQTSLQIIKDTIAKYDVKTMIE